MNEIFLKEKLINLGADLVGFSHIEKSPILNQNELVYAVSIAVKLPDAVLMTIANKPTMEYFHEYRTANALLDRLSFLCAREIEKLGYLAFPIAASQSTADDKSSYRGTFSHKIAARLSGLGYIGKSGLFITDEYGSKVRFATVLTNMPVEADRPLSKSSCGSCNLCVKACPAGAISGVEYELGMQREDIFSAEKCSKHMKNYHDIGRGSVCGLCIKACPKNRLK